MSQLPFRLTTMSGSMCIFLPEKERRIIRWETHWTVSVWLCVCASYGVSECSQSLSNWRESAKNFRFLLWHQQLMEKFAIEISLNGILNSISKCGLTKLIAFVFIWFSLWRCLPRFSTLLTRIPQFVYHTDQHWLQFAECSDDCVDRERACGWYRMRGGEKIATT